MVHLLQIHEPGQTPLPHAESVAIGIDLGTTHSVVAVADGERVQAIADSEGRTIIPSVVCYENDTPIVGHAALAAQDAGASVYSSIKRKMGKTTGDEASLIPVKISAEILRHMKHLAETALGKTVEEAVITVPAYFDDAARIATKDAARLAGLTVLRLINEPTAAALAYGLDTKKQGLFAIYDFGGGTFDVSILKLEDGVFQVLATAGDTELGGDDVDAVLAAYVSSKANETITPQLVRACRLAKETLSINDAAEVQGITLTPEILAQCASPLVSRSIALVERAIADAEVTVDEIDGVVLVGGSTRLQLVKSEVARFFGKAPLTDLNPDEVVALGAAIQAQALTKGADHLLLDVVPLSIGLETMGGIVEKIIHRNSPIPISVSQEFTTYQDGQTAMKIHVLQGEREKAADCRSLAECTLTNIPPMVAGLARIAVTFTMDADGLLTVTAREVTTGTEQKIDVNPAYGLAFETIERMLRDSMEHAQKDILERLLIEARVEAERLIGDVLRAIDGSRDLLKSGEEAMIHAQIARLQRVMSETDRDRIDYEVDQLDRLVAPFAERRMDAAIATALTGMHVDAVS